MPCDDGLGKGFTQLHIRNGGNGLYIFASVAMNWQHQGDFNYPNIKWDSESTESNTVEDKFIENISDNFLFQHITMPTR